MGSQNEVKVAIEEAKTLVLIGGLPCLAYIVSMLLADSLFLDNRETGMKLVCWVCGSAVVVSILLVLKRLIKGTR